MNAPSHGRKSTNSVHNAFAQPDRSRLRNTSDRTTISSQIQATNRKNNIIVQNRSNRGISSLPSTHGTARPPWPVYRDCRYPSDCRTPWARPDHPFGVIFQAAPSRPKTVSADGYVHVMKHIPPGPKILTRNPGDRGIDHTVRAL